MCLGLFFGVGIALARLLPYGDWMFIAAGLLFALAIVCGRVRWLFPALIALSACLLGMGRAGLELAIPPMPSFGRWEAVGTLDGRVRHGAVRSTFFLTDVQVRPEGGDAFTPIDSVLYVSSDLLRGWTPVHGERVSVSGTSYAPNVARNPGGFDQKGWLAQKGAHVRLYASGRPKSADGAVAFSIKGMSLSLSRRLGERMDALFGSASPVVRAMVLGDQSDVPDDWQAWLSQAGIAHILSVSGLHVVLWYFILEWLLRPLAVSPGVRFWLLAVLLAGYALLTGLEPPVLRATLMLLFMQAARVARRKVDPLTSLSVAAVAILLFRPLDLFAAGFQLSFCAVLGLSMLRPQLARVIRFRPAAVSASLNTTIAAQAGILPAQLSWFGYVSLVGFVVNVIAVPLSSLLIPVSVVALLLDALWPPLAVLPVHAAKGLVAEILWLSRVAAMPSFAVFRVGALSAAGTVVFFIGIVLCSSATVWRVRARAALMGALTAGAVLLSVLQGAFGVRYVQLDVGQALSGVLHKGNAAIVYDCGEAGSDLASYLMYTGARVEALFLSHPHTDHTAGIDQLLNSRIGIGTLYIPANADAFGAEPDFYDRLDRAEAMGAQIVEVAAGDTLTIAGLRAEVVAPEREPTRGNDPNDRSIVLLVEVGDRKLLLCGDADGTSEPLGVDCDVMQVAHHGSRNAARDGFLRDATPDVALLSTGRNSYGHPAPETVERLLSAGADVYNTRDSGAITVYFSGAQPRVETFIGSEVFAW